MSSSSSVHPSVESVESSENPEEKCWKEGQSYNIILFYRYVHIDDIQQLREKLLTICHEIGILGRILIAPEGINGTLAGSVLSIKSFIEYMGTDTRFSNIDWKTTHITGTEGNSLPFLSLSIRETKEIISCGRAKEFINSNSDFEEHSFGGLSGTGNHLSPSEFHEVRIALVVAVES